jgi:hypothetical protein
MNVFLKCFGVTLFFLSVIGSAVVAQIGYDASLWVLYIEVLLGGSLLSASIYWFMERILIPRRSKKLLSTMGMQLNGKLLTEDTVFFKLDQFEIYAQVYIQLRISDYGAAMQLISFHVPRKQLDVLVKPPYFKLIASSIEGIDTYLVYSTNAFTLNHSLRQWRVME